MGKVVGLGGVFFKSANRDDTLAWYRKHLGMETEPYGMAFLWREHQAPDRVGYTVWSPFADDTTYFDPADQPFMVNYRVVDLEGLMKDLTAAGVTQVGAIEQHENGKFGWILDPEGRKIELWEPVDPENDPYLPK